MDPAVDVRPSSGCDEQARESERFRALVLGAADTVAIVDEGGRLAWLSPSVERLIGQRPESLAGGDLLAIVHPDDRAQTEAALRELAGRPGGSATIQTRLAHRDGSWIDVEASASNLLGEQGVDGLALTIRDARERVALQHQLTHQVFHDSLTGLANRALLLDRLGHALARAERLNRSLSLIVADLDDLRAVNDGLGHSAGDELLAGVAGRMAGVVRAVDTVARLGGDEFAVLLEDTAGRGAQRVVGKLAEAMRPPFVIAGEEIPVTLSYGIAEHRRGAEAVELVRNAETATHAAKAAGKDRVEVFRPHLAAEVRARMQLVHDLARALDQGQIRFVYQPIVELASGRITGVEALVRWHHPDRGVISPADFIPVAEQSGLIVELGRQALHQATRQAAAWQPTEPDQPPLTVSVNLSARQLEHPGLVDEVERALAGSGLDPNRLVLEITETLLASDAQAAAAQLERLKQLNVRVAIDDFGTGYSALSYLQAFPVDVLKVDKTFVDTIAGAADESAVGRAIVQLGQTLNLVTVAEGIEHPEQLDALRALGCPFGQGYLFARPLPPEEVTELLAERAHARTAGSGGEPVGVQ
jgi:diguanylate cyclase (GGDEF)-like protein/PAS domain S-box-containing protein